MKTWAEEAKNLPAFLSGSPITLNLPDGTQLRFSPLTHLFPLGYSGLEVLRYGTQVNDFVDAVSVVRDFVGGYMFPTTELALAGL